MKRVYVASPLRAETTLRVMENIARARRLCRAAMRFDSVAAFAPHAFYTEFLDDSNPVERAIGTAAGIEWLHAADELWVFSKAGISAGMQHEIGAWIDGHDPRTVFFDPKCWEGIE